MRIPAMAREGVCGHALAHVVIFLPRGSTEHFYLYKKSSVLVPLVVVGGENFRNQDKPQENTGCRRRTKILEEEWEFVVISLIQSSLCCRWEAEWLLTRSELLWWSKGRTEPLSLQHMENHLSSLKPHQLSPWNHKHSAHLEINLTQAALDG